MSNYYFTAKNKTTGVTINFMALDNYFGHHRYGYKSEGVNGTVYSEEEFNNLFERID